MQQSKANTFKTFFNNMYLLQIQDIFATTNENAYNYIDILGQWTWPDIITSKPEIIILTHVFRYMLSLCCVSWHQTFMTAIRHRWKTLINLHKLTLVVIQTKSYSIMFVTMHWKFYGIWVNNSQLCHPSEQKEKQIFYILHEWINDKNCNSY